MPPLNPLQISPGSPDAGISPDVDTYAVTVGTDVDKVIVSADCTDENATKVVSGNEGLQMGENRVTCRVTAQDGETIKEYRHCGDQGRGRRQRCGCRCFFPGKDADSQARHHHSSALILGQGSGGIQKESTINIDGHKVQGWVWGSEARAPILCCVRYE